MRVEGAQLPHRPHPGHRHQRLLPRGDIGHRHSRRQRLPRPGRKLNWKHFGSSFGLENGLKLLSDSVTLPGGAATCSEGFVYFFLRVPQGCLAVLQLPCYPSKQGELLENMLQNLRNKWPPHPVPIFELFNSVGNLKPKFNWFFKLKLNQKSFSIELTPRSTWWSIRSGAASGAAAS